MRPVVQEETSGCAIACAAALAGVSYAAARAKAAELGIFAHDKALWSETAYMLRLLAAYGVRAGGELPFASWEALPPRALLAIKWRMANDRAFWHWTVFTRDADGPVVLDPKKALKTNTRRDFGRMKPKWYIPVHSDKE